MWWSPSLGREDGAVVWTAFFTGDYAREMLALGEQAALQKGLNTLRRRDRLNPTCDIARRAGSIGPRTNSPWGVIVSACPGITPHAKSWQSPRRHCIGQGRQARHIILLRWCMAHTSQGSARPAKSLRVVERVGMEDLHIALAQGHWTGEQASTKALYRALVAQAAGTGASLICLPEFSILPYFPGVRDQAGFRWAEPLQGGPSEKFFGELALEHAVTIVGSLFERDDRWTLLGYGHSSQARRRPGVFYP